MTNYLPWLIVCLLLGALLVIQQMQHNRTNRGLIDRMLENRGMAPLPDEHPLVDAVTKLASSKEPLTEQRKKELLERVRFKIPGMPEYVGKK